MPETADLLLQDHPDRWAWEKVRERERLTYGEGVRLMETGDLPALGMMADFVRRRLWGPKAFYGNSVNINHTNECILDCDLCAWKRPYQPQGLHPEAYVVDQEELARRVDGAVRQGAWEIHIVGGITPRLDLAYYERFLGTIKERAPHIFIQGFTAIEIRYIAQLHRLSPEALLRKFRDWGLGSVPGGGAELFHHRVRHRIARNKESAEEWLEIHATAHALGLHSNATMLYGTVERPGEIVHHLDMLRSAQDRSGGFLAFIPLAFLPENTRLEGEVGPTTGAYDARVFALSRIYLDNIPHLRVLWTYQGPRMTQALLSYGVDDIGGSSLDEEIAREAHGYSDNAFTADHLLRLIRESGRDPLPVNSLYEPAPPRVALRSAADALAH